MYRTFGAENLPASVTVVCDVCGRTVTTRMSGNTTRCPKRSGGCGNPIPIPTGSTRPPVTVDCYECRHQWGTRAREGTTVRCPECRHPRRVPTGARDRIDPGAPRVYRDDVPERAAPSRTAPRESGRGLLGSLADLFRAGAPDGSRRIDCLHCGHRWQTTAAPGNSIRCPECQRMRRIPTGSATPRTTAPRKAPAAPAPRAARPAPTRPAPAPQARPATPYDIERERNRRDRMGMLVRSLGGPLYLWVDQPPGACEVLDSTQLREHQRCTRPAAVVVHFRNGPTEGPAYACLAHGPQLASLAEGSPYITATVYPLRSR